jgi:hypothetical protein
MHVTHAHFLTLLAMSVSASAILFNNHPNPHLTSPPHQPRAIIPSSFPAAPDHELLRRSADAPWLQYLASEIAKVAGSGQHGGYQVAQVDEQAPPARPAAAAAGTPFAHPTFAAQYVPQPTHETKPQAEEQPRSEALPPPPPPPAPTVAATPVAFSARACDAARSDCALFDVPAPSACHRVPDHLAGRVSSFAMNFAASCYLYAGAACRPGGAKVVRHPGASGIEKGGRRKVGSFACFPLGTVQDAGGLVGVELGTGDPVRGAFYFPGDGLGRAL